MKTLTLVLRGSGLLTREIQIPNAKTYDPTGKETDKDEYFNDEDLRAFAETCRGSSFKVTKNGGNITSVYAIKEKTDTTKIVLIYG